MCGSGEKMNIRYREIFLNDVFNIITVLKKLFNCNLVKKAGVLVLSKPFLASAMLMERSLSEETL